MKQFIFLSSFLILQVSNGLAQLPDTDIWLFDINSGNDTIILSNPQNITKHKNYDNQPSFSSDGKYILFTSMRDAKQTDIYKYDIETKNTTQFTNTATSEYSPNVMPDGKNISVVMVEPDSTQRLWKFPIKGGEPSLIMKDVDSVGYYCWIDKKTIATCIIKKPMSLIVYTIDSQKKIMKTDSVGRSLHTIMKDKRTLLFYSKGNSIYSAFTDMNPNFKKWSEIWKESENEDFAFINNSILIGEHSYLYYYEYNSTWKDGNFKWRLINDLSTFGISNITRIAVSPDGKRIAIVAETKN